MKSKPRIIKAREGNWQVILPTFGFSKPHVVSGFQSWREALAYVEQRIRFRNLPAYSVKLSTEDTPRWQYRSRVWQPRIVV